MAGTGTRFQDRGYAKHKPFIDIFGKTMIETVMSNILLECLNCQNHRFIIVTQEKFLIDYKQELDGIKALFNNVEFITIDYVTDGPADTCLLAKALIDNSTPLLIANCDQLVGEKGWIDSFLNYCDNGEADGGILCILAKHKKWSFIDINDDKIITKCIEKDPITPLATTGHYYFKKGSDFILSAEAVKSSRNRVNGEMYVSHCYQYLIDMGKKFLPFMINNFYGLGTPEDLEKYINTRPL